MNWRDVKETLKIFWPEMASMFIIFLIIGYIISVNKWL